VPTRHPIPESRKRSAATSCFRRNPAIRQGRGCTGGVGWRLLGRFRRNLVATAIAGGLGRDLLTALFFLLLFLRQVPLAFFELVVWFGQVASLDCREGGMERRECLFVLHEDDISARCARLHRRNRALPCIRLATAPQAGLVDLSDGHGNEYLCFTAMLGKALTNHTGHSLNWRLGSGPALNHQYRLQIAGRKQKKPASNRPFPFQTLGKSLNLLVGARRFELPTPCTPCRCATRLRYAPTSRAL
jgi:hypothetical protein